MEEGRQVGEFDAALARELMKNVTGQRELSTVELFEALPGRVAFSVDVPETVLNYHGSVHGGFLATLLEIAAGMVATSLGVNNVALTSAVNFIKQAPQGRLVVRGQAGHTGRSTMIAHCRVELPDGKLLTEAVFTLFVLPPDAG